MKASLLIMPRLLKIVAVGLVLLATLATLTLCIRHNFPCRERNETSVADRPCAVLRSTTNASLDTQVQTNHGSDIGDLEYHMNNFQESLLWSQCIQSDSPITTRMALVSPELANQIKHKTVGYLNAEKPEKAVMLLKGAIANGTLTTNQKYVFTWFLGEALKQCGQDNEAISAMKCIVQMWKQLESPQRHHDDYAVSAARDLAHYYIQQGEYGEAIDYVHLVTQIGLSERRPAQLKRAQLDMCLHLLISCNAMKEAQELIDKNIGSVFSHNDEIYWNKRISEIEKIPSSVRLAKHSKAGKVMIRKVKSDVPITPD